MQAQSPITSDDLIHIRKVPTWYTKDADYTSYKKRNNVTNATDTIYNAIVRRGKPALQELKNLLSSQVLSIVPNTCTEGYFTVGQLAFLLIHDIEHIPYAVVTRRQWCKDSECGWLPSGFFAYIESEGIEFQKKYTAYLASKERKKYLKDNPRK